MICFAILIFSVTATRELKQQTDSFDRMIPRQRSVALLIRNIEPWLLLNLCVIAGIIVSALLVHLLTGLPIGSLWYGDIKTIKSDEVVFTMGRYLLTMIFFLNLWFILFAAAATLLGQFTKSPIVITFVLATTFFARQLGLLHLIAQPLRIKLPFNYTDFYAMIYRNGDYGAMNNGDLIAVFGAWSLICIALTAILNHLQRRHYIALLRH